MFENIKKHLAEKKKEKFLQKAIAEYYAYADSIDENKAAFANAFANEQEMREVFSEIYASCLGYEDVFSKCASFFSDYIFRIKDGYSRQYALYECTHWNQYVNRYSEYPAMKDELFFSDYYCDCKDTNVALNDLNVYISKNLNYTDLPVFKKAYSNELLQFCTNKDYRNKALELYKNDTLNGKYDKLKCAFSSTIPPRMELEELPERLNRMDNEAKWDAEKRYWPKCWKYLAHIVASKLEINVSDEYKDVVALTILLGLGCEDFIYVDNAVEYVESTLPFLELSVPAKDVEKLCYLAAERCKKEAEKVIEWRNSDCSVVEEMVRLVAEFGIIE